MESNREEVCNKDAATGKPLSFKFGKSYFATFSGQIKRFPVYLRVKETDRRKRLY